MARVISFGGGNDEMMKEILWVTATRPLGLNSLGDKEPMKEEAKGALWVATTLFTLLGGWDYN